MPEPVPAKSGHAIWRLFLPLLPWTVIATVLSVILRHWGLGWMPWALLAVLAVGAVVFDNLRRS